MLNIIWFCMIALSIITAAFNGTMEALTQSTVDAAKAGVDLAISLIGVMAFWLGLMKIAEDGGLLFWLARKLKPVMRKLFPDVPEEHPAMSAMIMNFSSNMLGLGNAATPFGLKAMQELNKINPKKGTATDAMCLFLAINTSNIAIFPLGVIALRAAMGSKDPAGIFLLTLIATSCSTLVAIVACKGLMRLRRYRQEWENAPVVEGDAVEEKKFEGLPDEAATLRKLLPPSKNRVLLTWALVVAFIGVSLGHLIPEVSRRGVVDVGRDVLSFWLIPILIGALLLYGYYRGVKVYESAIEGAKEGFTIATRIIPFLVAILVAVGMFRASGAMDVLIAFLSPATNLIGLPAEAVPMALLRPLSGSGAYAVMTDIMKTHGPDSFIGYLVATIQGSTETTFYVLAVYFGSISIKRERHTLPACLIAEVAGVIAALVICKILFQGV